MVFKLFFDISTSFRFSKDQCECTLHSEALPWLIVPVLTTPLQGPVLPHCIVIGQDAMRQRVNQMAMNLEKRIEIYCAPLPP